MTGPVALSQAHFSEREYYVLKAKAEQFDVMRLAIKIGAPPLSLPYVAAFESSGQ